MIDSLVKIVDQLISLAKYRETRTADHFNRTVRQIYADLMTSHSDYIAILERCNAGLDSDRSLSAVAEELASGRRMNEALRRSISALAGALAVNQAVQPFRDFFEAVSAYTRVGMYPGELNSLTQHLYSIISGALDNDSPAILEFARRYRKTGYAGHVPIDESNLRWYLGELLSGVLDRLREQWQVVSREYAKALAKTL